MTRMLGYSIKAWWLAIGLPIVAFTIASIVGAIVASMLVVCCAECRRRWKQGHRGSEIVLIHRRSHHD